MIPEKNLGAMGRVRGRGWVLELGVWDEGLKGEAGEWTLGRTVQGIKAFFYRPFQGIKFRVQGFGLRLQGVGGQNQALTLHSKSHLCAFVCLCKLP